jgi:hypothetical protein
MSTVKDYLKVIITALVTALVTIIASGFMNRESVIRNAATKNDITILKKETNKAIKDSKAEVINYTDDKFAEHGKIHDQLGVQYTQIQSDLTIIKNHLINKGS